jgi:hypothetical protein
MVYILILLVCIVSIWILSELITIDNQKPIFSLFFKFVIVISTVATFFAIFITGGKTIMLLWLLALVYLFAAKTIRFKKFNVKEAIQNSRWLLLAIPIVLFQYILFFDFTHHVFCISHDNILLSGANAKNLIEFKTENVSGVITQLYPQKFNGAAPYHYYELWITCILGYFSNLSYPIILQFITFPLLSYIFFLGLVSIIEMYFIVRPFHYVVSFILFFFGPIYFTLFESLFNHSHFMYSISEFVSQTLAFSFLGSKHLPLYIFSVLFFYFLQQKKYDLFYLFAVVSAITTIGVVPALYAILGVIFLFYKELRTVINASILLISSVCLIILYSILLQPNYSNVSSQTLLLSDLFTTLNFKGEIVRFGVKFISPFLWFCALYFATIILFIKYRLLIIANSQIKFLLLFLILLFSIGALFLCFIHGPDSDQFISTLFPIITVGFIFTIVYLLTVISKRYFIYTVLGVIFLLNCNYIIDLKQKYIGKIQPPSETYYNNVLKELHKYKMDVTLAYLLSDNTIQTNSIMFWKRLNVGKYFYIDNYTNFVNLNYPYQLSNQHIEYAALYPNNQMKFYIHDSIIPKENFEKYQLEFIQKYRIPLLFASKETPIPKLFKQYIDTIFYDTKTMDKCIVFKNFRNK